MLGFGTLRSLWPGHDGCILNFDEVLLLQIEHRAANPSSFTLNVSQRLLGDLQPNNQDGSILDLKTLHRGAKYVAEAIKMLGNA